MSGPGWRGVLDDRPARRWEDAFLSGNGRYGIMVHGDPRAEAVVFTDHTLVYPNGSRDLPPPAIAGRLAEVRADLLAGCRARAAARFCEGWELRWTQQFHPSHRMRIAIPEAGPVAAYRRGTDFATGEVVVRWRDRAGDWTRRGFVSRADDVVVQHLAAPTAGTLGATISLHADLDGTPPEMAYDLGAEPATGTRPDAAPTRVVLWLRGTYPAGLGAHGYEAVTLAVVTGGGARIRGTALEVSGARSVLLLTRLDRYERPAARGAQALRAALARLPADYDVLLARHVAEHQAIYERVRIDLGTDPAARALPVGELLARQLDDPSRLDPALLERLFDAGRYHLLSASGALPPRLTGLWLGAWGAAWSGDFTTDANLNLQVAGVNAGAMPEAMRGYAGLVLGQLDHWRVNARNLYGARGILAPPRTDGEHGYLSHFEPAYPFHAWTAGADWLLHPLHEHYLMTGDEAFLRDRLAPALRELALFYEDFLGHTGGGTVVLAPSYSPENTPAGGATALAVNATMDLAAARHALATAIQACDHLGLEQGPGQGVERWRELLARLPPYRVNRDGALAEWAWPGLEDSYDHRHVSHLYPVWPLHEITPDGTPDLADAARTALRLRGDENLSAHGSLHRALAWARLKDGEQAAANLRKVVCRDMVFRSLMTAHYPGLDVYNADAAHALPAVLIELLVHTRPGVVELLPALPGELPAGRITGVRGLGRITVADLRWDLPAGTVDATLRADTAQTVTLVSRRGIAAITAAAPTAPAPAGSHARILTLPEGAEVPVAITLPPQA